MKTLLTLVGLFIFTLGNADEGQDLYKTNCIACHTIGKGKLIGPDLLNISDKRNQEWLVSFIKSSQSMIKSGDKDAIAILEEFNGIMMPDYPFTDAQILSILAFIESEGTEESEEAVAVVIIAETTSINIDAGAFLFSGETRLINGGAACNSCHNVKDERIFSGGTLAKDLTESWDIMGSLGVAAIIRSSPFPVMNMAYNKHPITEEEVINLTAYLKSVSEEKVSQRSSDISLTFAIFGILFFISIIIISVILYFKRKSRPVNYDILNRPSNVIN